MFVVAAALLTALLVLLGARLVLSPGTPAPLLDAAGRPLPGSLSEKIHVEVNGLRQGMFVKSKDPSHPVLLYLHGGMPDYFLTQQYPTGLEDSFTVVWWEQRGSGMSYSADLAPGTLTLEQLILDTLALTNYLRQRFARDKIYLMGHPGGTFLGIQVVARAPQLYHAYIGVAQMSYQLESERLAYEYMLHQVRASGNKTLLDKLLTRRCPVVDPDDHHLYASLGCAAENLLLAASFRTAGRAFLSVYPAGPSVGPRFPS